jgi:hypothetical protein
MHIKRSMPVLLTIALFGAGRAAAAPAQVSWSYDTRG